MGNAARGAGTHRHPLEKLPHAPPLTPNHILTTAPLQPFLRPAEPFSVDTQQSAAATRRLTGHEWSWA